MEDLFGKCYNFKDAKELMASGFYPYFRAIESGQDTEVSVGGRRMIMIGSNNYLGLTSDPRVKEAAIEAVQKYGSGCTGSRFLNGNLDIHDQLEEELAEFVGKEATLVFTTGFMANLGTISTLVGRNDCVLTDRENHASIFEGCRLAFGKTLKYPHQEMAELERLLKNLNEEEGCLIVVDGVFSMEGDICNLPELVRLAKEYEARIMVDDAHAVGVFGERGTGTPEHFGLTDEVDIIMGTFSKSFASIGGFIAADAEIVHYIKHQARALMFAASMPPAAVAAVRAALKIIQEEPERRQRLWENTEHMREGLQSLGFDTGRSQSPIIPIVLGDDLTVYRLWHHLVEEGVFTNPIVSPATPKGRALIRTSYSATHTPEQINRALEAFETAGQVVGVI